MGSLAFWVFCLEDARLVDDLLEGLLERVVPLLDDHFVALVLTEFDRIEHDGIVVGGLVGGEMLVEQAGLYSAFWDDVLLLVRPDHDVTSLQHVTVSGMFPQREDLGTFWCGFEFCGLLHRAQHDVSLNVLLHVFVNWFV